MREIHDHETNAANKSIRLTADDADPDNGNASHVYALSWRELPQEPQALGYEPTKDAQESMAARNARRGIGHVGYQQEVVLRFQHGPIGEVGVNGITNEALLAIVIDRLRGFQSSKYANGFNANALVNCESALRSLQARTAEREQRGVEGTHQI